MISTRQPKTKISAQKHEQQVTDYLPQFLPEIPPSQKKFQNIPSLIKKPGKKVLDVKRTSPFLVLSIISPLLLLVVLVAEEKSLSDKFLMVGLYVVAEVNLLFIDFALWNYFEGRRKLIIWIVEGLLLMAAYLVWIY